MRTKSEGKRMDKKPSNIDEIKKSFSIQAARFENPNMNFSKQEYLDYTVRCMDLKGTDEVLEAAAGTCACGRCVAPYVKNVTCLDVT
jgi:ubiquinone/menaquinone biosynthesis C-methylase UbiE